MTSLRDEIASIFSMSTEARLQKIQAEINDRSAIKTAKFEEHDGLLVNVALGDAAAKKRADQLKREMDVLDIEVRDLYRAFEQCTVRHEAELRAKAVAEQLKNKEVARSILVKRATVAAKMDRTARQFAEELADFQALTHEAFDALPVKDERTRHNSVLSAQSADNSARVALRCNGVEWATPYAPPVKTTMAEQVDKQNAAILELLDK